MRKIILVSLIFMLLLTSGCGYGMIDAEQTAVGAGLGADLDQQGNILFYGQFNRPINVQQAGAGDNQVEVFSGKGQTPTQAARDLILVMPRLPVWSHADIFVLGENLSETDLTYITDFLARNRNVRGDSFMLQTHGITPYDVFSGTCPMATCSSRGLVDIMRWQELQLGTTVMITSTEFLSKLHASGMDPVIPRVTIVEHGGNKVLTVDGLAVFQKNRLVGFLNEKESRGYRWLNPRTSRGGLIILEDPLPGVSFLTLEVTRFNSNTRAQIDGDTITMQIKLDVQVNFYDQGGSKNIQNPEDAVPIESAAAEEIESQIRACINKSQELNSDILSWGNHIHRHHFDEWQKLKPVWYEILPGITADVQVRVRLRGSSLLNQSPQLRR